MANRTCSIEGCESPAKARGWCRRHYSRWWKRGGDPAIRYESWDLSARPQCSIEGCDQIARGRGFCSAHYHRWLRHGDPLGGSRPRPIGRTEAERFFDYVEKAEDCWLWTGGRIEAGYGSFMGADGRTTAHRWSYEHHHGPIPAELVIDHVCHNIDPTCAGGACDHRRCVNPDHLEAVTQGENIARGAARKRMGSSS